MGVKEMKARVGSSKLATNDVDEGADIAPITDAPLRTPATTDATIAEIVPTTNGNPVVNGGSC